MPRFRPCPTWPISPWQVRTRVYHITALILERAQCPIIPGNTRMSAMSAEGKVVTWLGLNFGELGARDGRMFACPDPVTVAPFSFKVPMQAPPPLATPCRARTIAHALSSTAMLHKAAQCRLQLVLN
jgi:hypothetical protein